MAIFTVSFLSQLATAKPSPVAPLSAIRLIAFWVISLQQNCHPACSAAPGQQTYLWRVEKEMTLHESP
jgi:hypothetical protein